MRRALLLRRTFLVAARQQQQQQQQRNCASLRVARTFAALPEQQQQQQARSPPRSSSDAMPTSPTPAAPPPPAPTPAAPAPPPAAAPPSYLHRTVFRRPLNAPAVAFSSPAGRELFSRALRRGTAEGFFPLIEQYSTQDEPAYCGLASLAMVLNALCVDPRRPWKGPWRFYSEALLDCCIPLERVREEGVSLPQVACLARCNGAVARVVRPPPFEAPAVAAGIEGEEGEGEGEGGGEGEGEGESEAARAAVAEAEAEFRAAVLAACRGGPESIVASYSRALVSQTGEGHFSPIGAFDEASDAVLVLDVARFKYSPHWLPLRSLVRAMRAVDAATGRPRGWLGVRAAQAPRSVLFTLGGTGAEAAAAAAAARVFAEETLPELLLGSDSSSPSASSLVSRAAAAAPLAAVAAFVGLRAPSAAAAAETAAAAAALAAALGEGGGGGGAGAAATGAEAAAAAGGEGGAHACGSEAVADASGAEDASDGATAACAIPDAAAALLAELEAWPALRAVRAALDEAHPPSENDAGGSKGGNGCSARSSAAASVAGRADVARAAAVAARGGEADLGSSGLLPERLALLLAVAASAAAEAGGSSSARWPAAATDLLTPRPGSVLAAEVGYLRAQWKELPALDEASAASAKAAGKGCGCG